MTTFFNKLDVFDIFRANHNRLLCTVALVLIKSDGFYAETLSSLSASLLILTRIASPLVLASCSVMVDIPIALIC